MKKRNLTDIKNILKGAINENFYRYGYKIFLLKQNWESIVGEKLYLYTSPEIIKNKSLNVYCIHQGWINALQFHKLEILNNIKNKFGDYFGIENVVFKFGKIEKKEDMIQENLKKNEINNLESDNCLLLTNITSKEDLVNEMKKIFENYDKNRIK
ncbi:MAG TPA: DUF721 domain-containing protein [Spirochaetota bacterium]|nr:DUF721 domain-containing protein [Spirochaetota bacterium]